MTILIYLFIFECFAKEDIRKEQHGMFLPQQTARNVLILLLNCSDVLAVLTSKVDKLQADVPK